MYGILIDFILVAIFLRGFLVYKKGNLLFHLFLLLGVLGGIVLALHYYVSLGEYLQQKIIFIEGSSQKVAFCLLAGSVPAMAYFIQAGWQLILRTDVPDFLNEWGGLILCAVRYYLIAAIVWVGFVIVGNEKLSESARLSLSGRLLKRTAVSLYFSAYEIFIRKFAWKESLNQDALDVVEMGQRALKEKKKQQKKALEKKKKYNLEGWDEADSLLE